jgi:autotransporter-associated beta strand protein
MRPKALSGSIAKYSRGLALSVLTLIGASQASGTIYYWDNNGGTANDWASATNWSTVVGGGGAGAIPGSSDVATFSATPIQGTAQTVNLNANRSVLGLDFLSGVTTATTLQGGGTARTLTIGASGITNASTSAVTIGSSTGTQNVNITLNGSQTWTNSSNFAGEFRFRGLVTGANTTLTLAGTGTSVTYLSGGLTLSGTGGLVISKSGSNPSIINGTQIFQGNITLGGSGGITINSGAAPVSFGTNPGSTAQITANQNWANNSSNALFVGGALTINSQLSLTAGTVTFGDYANIGAGGVVINGGTAEAGNNATFGPNTLTLTSGTVSSDTINARSFSNAVTVNGNVTIGNATKKGALTFTGLIGLGAATRQFTTASDATFSNIVSGAVGTGLTKAGTGTLTLSGANTYGGPTTVNNGTLLFTVPGSLYNSTSGSWTAANITVANGATLALGVGGAGFTSGNVDTIKAIGTASTGFTNGSFLGLDTTLADFSYGNAIGNTNSGANSVGLKKSGTKTLTLSGTNTYTGTTTVNDGTLLFTAPSALYNSTTASWTAANITVLSGKTLALRVGGAGFTSGNVDTIKAIGTASTGFTNGSFLGLDTSNGDFSYSTAIGNTNGGENSVGLVKLGNNILTLSNANTFTGTTTILGRFTILAVILA